MIEMMSPLEPTATLSGAAISRLSAGTLAKPAPRPNTPPRKPIAPKAAKPPRVRCVFQSMRVPAAGSVNSPSSLSMRAERVGIDQAALGRARAPDHDRNGDHQRAEQRLQQVGSHAEADDRAGDRADRAGEAERHHQPQARHAAPQELRPGGERAGEGEHQPGAAHEVEVKGKEAADDRHEQHAAADPGQHRHHADQEADRGKRDRPDPPRDAGCSFHIPGAMLAYAQTRR